MPHHPYLRVMRIIILMLAITNRQILDNIPKLDFKMCKFSLHFACQKTLVLIQVNLKTAINFIVSFVRLMKIAEISCSFIIHYYNSNRMRYCNLKVVAVEKSEYLNLI